MRGWDSGHTIRLPPSVLGGGGRTARTIVKGGTCPLDLTTHGSSFPQPHQMMDTLLWSMAGGMDRQPWPLEVAHAGGTGAPVAASVVAHWLWSNRGERKRAISRPQRCP